jgi:AraC family transcriptional regulator
MKRATREDYDRRLLRAQRLVESRLDQPVSPQEVARHAGFSLHHFHRIFRAQLGESVMQHVRRLRLERSARALKAQQLTPAAVGAPSKRLIELALEAMVGSSRDATRGGVECRGFAPAEGAGRPLG